MRRPAPGTIAHLLLLATVMVWGATFVVVKDALQDATPLLFNLLRMTLAFVLLAVLNHRHLRNLSRRAIASGIVAGTLLAAGYQFQTTGLARTTPAKSAFITGLVVVFVPLLTAVPALRLRGSPAPRWTAALGAALAFGGVLLLTTPAGTAWRHIFSSIGLGDLLTLACAVAFAGHLVALSHASPGLPAPQLATLQIGVAACVMLLTLPLAEYPQAHFTPRLILALAATSVLGTAAAFTIQSWAQKHLPPTHTAVILSLEPVFAWLTALIFLHERLGPRALGGAAFIVAGIAVTEFLQPAATTLQSPPAIPV